MAAVRVCHPTFLPPSCLPLSAPTAMTVPLPRNSAYSVPGVPKHWVGTKQQTERFCCGEAVRRGGQRGREPNGPSGRWRSRKQGGSAVEISRKLRFSRPLFLVFSFLPVTNAHSEEASAAHFLAIAGCLLGPTGRSVSRRLSSDNSIILGESSQRGADGI